MGEDSSVIEQRIADDRHDLDATLEAIAHQANLGARLPEYVDELVGTIASVAMAQVLRLGSSVAKRADVLASLATDAVKRVPRGLLRRGFVGVTMLGRRLLRQRYR